MTKTTFVDGTVVTAEFCNAINNPKFVANPQYDGENPLISNDDLSNEAGQIKPEWVTFRDAFKVTAGSGATISYTGGTVTKRDGTRTTIASGLLALPNDATQYIFIDQNGAIAQSSVIPVYGVPLAQVTTVAGQISGAIVDMRPRYEVKPRADLISVFGGLGGDGEYILSSGTATLSGEKSYTRFEIGETAILNCPSPLKLRVAGDVIIRGVINVAAIVKGGPRHVGAYQPGGYAGFAGSGFAGAAGVNDESNNNYSYFVSPIGSGGCGGTLATTELTYPFSGTRGGDGGGSLIIEATGKIEVSGSIYADGTAGDGYAAVSFDYGAVAYCTGGSGGSGGLIWLKSLIQVAGNFPGATLSVRGGAGGLGYPLGSCVYSGGGGGGYIVCEAPSVNLTGANLLLDGGFSATYPGATLGGQLGASFAGKGGAAASPGDPGQLVIRQVLPL